MRIHCKFRPSYTSHLLPECSVGKTVKMFTATGWLLMEWSNWLIVCLGNESVAFITNDTIIDQPRQGSRWTDKNQPQNKRIPNINDRQAKRPARGYWKEQYLLTGHGDVKKDKPINEDRPDKDPKRTYKQKVTPECLLSIYESYLVYPKDKPRSLL